MTKKKTTIVGHRGFGSSITGGTSIYPENSLFSFKRALDENIDGVELDVWLTKDKQVIAIHGTDDGLLGNTVVSDETLKNEKIEELTSNEIRSFHFKEPWILAAGEKCNVNILGNSSLYYVLNEDEKVEKRKAYGTLKNGYMNIKESEHIEKIINDILFNTSIANDIEKMKIEKDNAYENASADTIASEMNYSDEHEQKKMELEMKIEEESEREQEEVERFEKEMACSHCKYIYQHYITNRCYDLKKKKMFFKYVTMFYHVPLLKDVLDVFQNRMSYDIELKGTKEDLGLYILDVLKDYKQLNVKFSSFQWIMNDNKIKKKVNKHKNLKNLDYDSYPHYNMDKIDLLKVLRNNSLNIPIALLFSVDPVMPNFDSILRSLNYYKADWAHFSFNLNKQPIKMNCNKKDKFISPSDFIKLLHKNKKKIMIYWGAEEKDCEEDILFFLKEKVDSICPNDINLAKSALGKIKTQEFYDQKTLEKNNPEGETLVTQGSDKRDENTEKHADDGSNDLKTLNEKVDVTIFIDKTKRLVVC